MENTNNMRDKLVVGIANLVLTLASKKYRTELRTIQELGWQAYIRQARGPQPRLRAPVYATASATNGTAIGSNEKQRSVDA